MWNIPSREKDIKCVSSPCYRCPFKTFDPLHCTRGQTRNLYNKTLVPTCRNKSFKDNCSRLFMKVAHEGPIIRAARKNVRIYDPSLKHEARDLGFHITSSRWIWSNRKLHKEPDQAKTIFTVHDIQTRHTYVSCILFIHTFKLLFIHSLS